MDKHYGDRSGLGCDSTSVVNNDTKEQKMLKHSPNVAFNPSMCMHYAF